jgi:hypothetical protein
MTLGHARLAALAAAVPFSNGGAEIKMADFNGTQIAALRVRRLPALDLSLLLLLDPVLNRYGPGWHRVRSRAAG